MSWRRLAPVGPPARGVDSRTYTYVYKNAVESVWTGRPGGGTDSAVRATPDREAPIGLARQVPEPTWIEDGGRASSGSRRGDRRCRPKRLGSTRRRGRPPGLAHVGSDEPARSGLRVGRRLERTSGVALPESDGDRRRRDRIAVQLRRPRSANEPDRTATGRSRRRVGRARGAGLAHSYRTVHPFLATGKTGGVLAPLFSVVLDPGTSSVSSGRARATPGPPA